MTDMPYKLKITFEGLCGLVYNNKEKAMSVLLMDGRKPGLSKDKKRFLTHIPSISFAASDLDGNTEQEKLAKFDFYTTNQQRTKDVFWILDGDDLELRAASSGSFSSESLSLPLDFKDFIPAMDKIYSPDGIRVDSKYLSSGLDSNLVGRMRFTTGNVTVEKMLGYNFEFEGGCIYKDVARIVSFTISSSAEKVELRSKNQDMGYTLKLRKDESNRQPVEITIKNMPPHYIDPTDFFSRDFDFELIYRMADPTDIGKYNQLRVSRKIKAMGATPASIDSQVCSMARFNDDDRA